MRDTADASHLRKRASAASQFGVILSISVAVERDRFLHPAPRLTDKNSITSCPGAIIGGIDV